jgi:hypothetical protein
MIDLLRRALASRNKWVNLTEEEIDELWRTTFKNNTSINEFCRAIEAKLKEKNHGGH